MTATPDYAPTVTVLWVFIATVFAVGRYYSKLLSPTFVRPDTG